MKINNCNKEWNLKNFGECKYIARYDENKRQSYETEIQPDGTEKFYRWRIPEFSVEINKRFTNMPFKWY